VNDLTAPFQTFQQVWKWSNTNFSTKEALSFVFRRFWTVGNEGGRKGK